MPAKITLTLWRLVVTIYLLDIDPTDRNLRIGIEVAVGSVHIEVGIGVKW